MDDYVYEIETETLDFSCGFPLIVHNTDSFVFSLSSKDIIKDLKNLEDLFDSINLIGNHEVFSIKNKKVIGKFKIETPEDFWIDESICLRSKMCAFKCADDSKNKLKCISKSN